MVQESQYLKMRRALLAKTQADRELNKYRKNNASRPRRRRSRGGGASAGTSPAAAFARMLDDPCNAEMHTGVYPGEIGAVQRAVADFSTAGGAGNTCGYVMYWPSVNAADQGSTTAGNVIISHNWTVAAPFSPGHSLFQAVASKSRCLGACLQLSPASLSLTNIVGEVTVGCVSSDMIPVGAGALTIDQLFNTLSLKSVLQRKPVEVKFTPGTFDNRYNSYGVAATADTSDTNVLVIAWRGIPAGTAFSARITALVEYTAKSTSSIAASAAATSGGLNHLAVTTALHKHKPSWFHNLYSHVAEDAGLAARYVARTAMAAGANKASQYFLGEAAAALPMLL